MSMKVVHGKSDWSRFPIHAKHSKQTSKSKHKRNANKTNIKKSQNLLFCSGKTRGSKLYHVLTNELEGRPHTSQAHSQYSTRTHTHTKTYGIRYGSYGISTHYKKYQKNTQHRPSLDMCNQWVRARSADESEHCISTMVEWLDANTMRQPANS